MRNDEISLIATAALGLFFFVTGLLDIADHFLVKMILLVGFGLIVVNIICVLSKDDQQKNLPK